MNYVVGSGPSAVACASALLQRGQAVCMLDAGITLEPERARLVQSLSQRQPAQWQPPEVERLKEGMSPSAAGIPQKLIFGSNYPYREAVEQLGLDSQGVGLEASLALGGFSTVWGGSMLPYLQSDLSGWPISNDDLAPHYKAAVELTGLSAERDGLAERFPLHTDTPGHLEASRQAQVILRKLDRHQEALRRTGVTYGRARVAIQAAREPQKPGCVYCGMCMYGCPYGYIYSAEQTLPRLKQHGDFRYQPDVVVRTVEELNGGVRISGHDRATGASVQFEGDRVYLAAGVIATTGILLRSLQAYDQPVTLKDSQYFLLPSALAKRVPDVRREALHALSQLYLEIMDSAVSAYNVHLQVYSYNDLIGRTVAGTMGPIARLFPFLARELEGRLVLLQGYLHSAESDHIVATLRRNSSANGDTLQLRATATPQVKANVRRVMWKLLRQSPRLGLWPLPMLLQLGKPGRGFHVGGSFPMQSSPRGLQSDILGRPTGCQRIHAVDATVLPSVPATTITLAVMANAHRIGWESAGRNR
jgi:choline dehydrogenase-like flavoprotein